MVFPRTTVCRGMASFCNFIFFIYFSIYCIFVYLFLLLNKKVCVCVCVCVKGGALSPCFYPVKKLKLSR